MCFQSILFPGPDDPARQEGAEAPAHFHDLNLDQIVETITANWREYELAPFFHAPQNDLDAIVYRQEIMRDLEDLRLMQAIKLFSQKMRDMHVHLPRTKKHYYKYHKERLFLGAVGIYCEAVEALAQSLAELDLASRGLRAFREYLAVYLVSDSFRKLATEGARLRDRA